MNVKTTEQQRAELLALYAVDRDAARDLSIKFGLCEQYAEILAGRRGVKCMAPDRRGGPRTTHNDPRWEWAKQRGAVIA